MTNERYQKYKEGYKKYAIAHKAERRKNSREWGRKNKEYVKANNDNYFFGGNRAIALERDNWTCQDCGMNNEQHIVLFGKGITVDHIDGKGKYTKDKNNELNNLRTLCLRCHGKKDGLRSRN